MKKRILEELERCSPEEFKRKKKIPCTFLLENIRSLLNVGSAFRTADAFLIEKIILAGFTGTPPHREIQKTALGATESVDWEYYEKSTSILSQLKQEGYIIIAIEQTDQSISLLEFQPKKEEKYCFIFGNEVAGVSEEALQYVDSSIEIPQYGTKHSLNISVAVGIIAWDFVTKYSI